MIVFRIYPEDEPPPPGPGWEPVLHDGKFPLTANPGDLYVNRYADPPIWYVFTTSHNCERVSPEELKSWVIGGKMKNPGRVQSTKDRRGLASSLPSE